MQQSWLMTTKHSFVIGTTWQFCWVQHQSWMGKLNLSGRSLLQKIEWMQGFWSSIVQFACVPPITININTTTSTSTSIHHHHHHHHQSSLIITHHSSLIIIPADSVFATCMCSFSVILALLAESLTCTCSLNFFNWSSKFVPLVVFSRRPHPVSSYPCQATVMPSCASNLALRVSICHHHTVNSTYAWEPEFKFPKFNTSSNNNNKQTNW